MIDVKRTDTSDWPCTIARSAAVLGDHWNLLIIRQACLGTRRFDVEDQSTNVWWLAIPSFGESWHNLHHADPISARHGAMRGQLDSAARLIWLMEKLGYWDASYHVPMVVRDPRVTAESRGRRVDAFTEHVDVTTWVLPPGGQLPDGWDHLIDGNRLTPPPLDVEGYAESLERCRVIYPSLRIRSGVELSEPLNDASFGALERATPKLGRAARSTDDEKQSQLTRLADFHERNKTDAPKLLAKLRQTVIEDGNVLRY